MPSLPHIAVVGGGISGLAAAWRLHTLGAEVTLFEASERTGGVIRSVRGEGFLVDEGPNTLVARSRAVEDVIEALGLTEQRVWASDAAAHRFVVKDGALAPVPSSPLGLARTPLLSARAKLRLLAEPFVRRGVAEDESLAAFVRRRLGAEVLGHLVDPFVAGVWAGDPERLSARLAFPTLHALEREHGSLARGLAHRLRHGSGSKHAEPKPSPRPFSFRGGMQALPDAFAGLLGDRVRLSAPVVGLRPEGSGWTVTAQTKGSVHEARFDGVVFAAPVHRLPEIDTPLAVPPPSYAAVSVLALGFRRADVAHPLGGFGVLVPAREPFRLLGALFSSTLFPGRAPAGHVLLTCFLGGTRHPPDASLPTDALAALALADLRPLVGVRAEPVFVHRRLWSRAIPQYEVGYDRVLAALADLEARHARLRFAGNVRGGISVGDALASGLAAADRISKGGGR